MADTSYDIIFTGRLVAGADPAAVRANLARLFKVDASRVEALFAGGRTVVKRGLDAAGARTYQAALARAGTVAEVLAVEPAGTPPAAAARTSPPVAPDYTVAEPGVELVPPTTVEPPLIPTDHLTLAEVGADLVEATVEAAPEYDLSGLALDPPGTLLAEPLAIPPPDFDLSGLALAD